MAKKKARAQDKADAFLAGLGTAGGPIGAPGLVQFGAGDVQRQVITGNSDNYWSLRDPEVNTSPLPQDLDASYLKLNLPGSPLPMNALTSVQNVVADRANQQMFLAQYQMTLAQMMPPAGFQQLPLGYPPPKKK
jgi:hypothetical protein